MTPQRLSGQDAAFLAFEGPGRPMHVGALALLDVPPGQRSDELARTLRSELARGLSEIPLFRSRLDRQAGAPRWRPVPGFDARRHVRIRPLEPASDLLDRTGELFARPLDPGRPLWEVWILPGADRGRRVAVLVKAHHAMLDGTAGLAVLARLLEPDGPASPRLPAPRRPAEPPRRRARGLLDLVMRLLRGTASTSLNGPIRAAREIAVLDLDEQRLRRAARRVGGTTNDALLALVGDGVARWLAERGEHPGRRGLRAFCPVDVRGGGEASALGNRLGAWLVDLPVAERSFDARLRAAVEATRATRATGHAAGVDWLGRLADFLPGLFPRLGMALAGRLRAFNLVVTHVRGPDRPLRLAGARLASLTVLAPVFPNQRCSIAAFRLDGRIHLGLTGAWPRAGECRALAAAIGAAYDDLCEDAPDRDAPLRRAAAGRGGRS